MNKLQTIKPTKSFLVLSLLGINRFASNTDNVIKEEIVLETSPDALISKDIYFSHLKEQKSFENDLLDLDIQKLEKLKKKESLSFEIDRIQKTNDINNLITKENQIKNKKLDLEYKKLEKETDYVDKYPNEALGFKITEDALVQNLIKAKIEEEKSGKSIAENNNAKLLVFQENLQSFNEIKNINNTDITTLFLELFKELKGENNVDVTSNITEKITLLLNDFDAQINKLMFKIENGVFSKEFLILSKNILTIKTEINDINIKNSTKTLTTLEIKDYEIILNKLIDNNKKVLNQVILDNKNIISNFSEKNITIEESVENIQNNKDNYAELPKKVQEEMYVFDKKIDNLKEAINVIGTPQKELLKQLLLILEIDYNGLSDEQLRNILLNDLKETYKTKFKTLVSYEVQKEEEIANRKVKAEQEEMRAKEEEENRKQIALQLEAKAQYHATIVKESNYLKENFKIIKFVNNEVVIKNFENGQVFRKQKGNALSGWEIKDIDVRNSQILLVKDEYKIIIGIQSLDMEDYNKRMEAWQETGNGGAPKQSTAPKETKARPVKESSEQVTEVNTSHP